MSKINLDTLILYDNIRQDEIVNADVKILNEFDYHEYISYMEAEYYQIQRKLLAKTGYLDIEGTYWQNYICRLIAESENRFSLMSETGKLDENIRTIAIREMEELRKLYHVEWGRISAIFHDAGESVCSMKQKRRKIRSGHRDLVRLALESAANQKTADKLRDYYGQYGCGIFERYQAFVWDEILVGVTNYDKITFDQLIGYGRQKEALIENTEFFLKGYPANNALLHGDRGTGKSSCVKALLNHFIGSKLKLISLNKNHVSQLYRIIESIADRGCKFVIFIDDLSFEDTETEYKQFKSIMEGGIEAQPPNVLIYVTSNRRNIIKETWKDRGDSGEVHSNDGMQERLSLSDRFGLSITFPSPDKETFLNIVKGLAEQEKLGIDESVLIEEALRWDVRQRGRSGREARQFINYIHARVMKEQEKINHSKDI
ncbi:MAG: ATP-binding protein [Eubacteriales bacterium]|nr:ATP-binding protein [Eubacteriales bacterium]